MEVALFSVSATLRISASGVRAKSWMESTAPKELIETCGSSTCCAALRAKAIEDDRVTSIAPSASISLSAAG